MLSSESKAPLIIDQPEDNLDSEFIYNTLVPAIRRAIAYGLGPVSGAMLVPFSDGVF